MNDPLFLTLPEMCIRDRPFADLTVTHTQEVGQQDHIPLALRQLRQSVGQKIAAGGRQEAISRSGGKHPGTGKLTDCSEGLRNRYQDRAGRRPLYW